MKPFHTIRVGLLAGIIAFPGLTVAKESQGDSTGDELREVIVSHTDEKGILKLFAKHWNNASMLSMGPRDRYKWK